MSSNIILTNATSNDGFLCGFVEASIEKPADGLNGDCVVHYKDQYRQCEMVVPLVNGVREGVGTIMKEGAPFIQIEFCNGAMSGSVCRMDDYGMVELRGHLLNGMESGLFEEYDRSRKVVWRGYYRNGVRYSEVVKSGELEGWCDEKSVSSGLLLSIAEYDRELRDKNGRCFEFENGSLKNECMYENGVKKHTIREFVNDGMIVYDSKGKKVYEGKWFGDMKNGFLCHEPMEGMKGFFKEVDSSGQLMSVSEYDELNVYKNGKCFEMENGNVKRVCNYQWGIMKEVLMEFDGMTMIEYNDKKKVYEGEFKGDMKNGFVREGKGCELDGERVKRVCVYENGEMKRVIQEFNGYWMIEYDENGKKVYEGKYGGDMKNGFVRNGDGYCLDVNGNDMEYCLYENGDLMRVLIELKGREMTEYDDNGKKRYVGESDGDMKNGFVRNGRGYCLDEREIVKQYCVFEKGVLKRVIEEFDDETMREYNENGVMSYLGEFDGDTKNGFVREGKGKEYGTDGKKAIYSGEWKDGKREGYGTEYCDGHALYTGEWKNGMRNGKGEEMDGNGKVVYEGGWWNGRRNGIGNVNGTRWIGHWKDGKRNGMGYERDENGVVKRGCLFENGEMKRVVQEFNDSTMIEYDENGRKVYEGEFNGNVENGFVRNGFGKEYALIEESSKPPIIQSLLCCWVRENELVEKTYNEEIVEGIWKEGVFITDWTLSSLPFNPMEIIELEIGNSSYNYDSVTELKLIGLIQLKRIVIGNEYFGKVRLFELDGLGELESIVIGEKSFRISYDERNDGVCRIMNCPKLKSIQIGNDSFSDYHSFELNNLPSLQSIDIGHRCFYYASSFSLTGLID